MRALAAATLLLAPSAAGADALQDRVLAAARATSADRFAFRRTTRVEQTGSDPKVFVEAFDPRAAANARWSLVSVDGHAPTPKNLSGWRKRDRGPVPSYSEVAKWFGGPAVATPAGPGRVLYRFARLPAGAVKINGRDLSADTQAEALVNTAGRVPFVERTRLKSTKGFRIMLVAKLDSMTAAGRYRQLADGSVVPDAVLSDFAGSLMGKGGTMKVSMTFADVHAVR